MKNYTLKSSTPVGTVLSTKSNSKLKSLTFVTTYSYSQNIEDIEEKKTSLVLRGYLHYTGSGTPSADLSTFKIDEKEIQKGGYKLSGGKGYYLLGSANKEVNHHDDGIFPNTKIITSTSDSYGFSGSVEGTINSSSIPVINVQATILSATNNTSDVNTNLYTSHYLMFNNLVSSLTNSLSFNITNSNGISLMGETSLGNVTKNCIIDFGSGQASSEYQVITFPKTALQLAQLIPNEKYLNINYKVTTKKGDTVIGSNSYTYQFKIDLNGGLGADYTPKIECDDSTFNLIGVRNKFIKNFSKVKATIENATINNGSTISKYIFSNSSQSKEETSSSTVFDRAISGNDTYYFNLLDSRGNRSANPKALQLTDSAIINYSVPQITLQKVARTDSTSTTVKGEIKGTYYRSIASLTNAVTIRYRLSTGQWTNATVTNATDGTFTTSFLINNIATTTDVVVEVEIKDKLSTLPILKIPVTKSVSLTDRGKDYFNVNGEMCNNDNLLVSYDCGTSIPIIEQNVQLLDCFKNNIYPKSRASLIAYSDTNLKAVIDGLVGTVLYNSADGTNGNVTLSSSSANFKKLKIFFKSNDDIFGSVEIEEPNGKSVNLHTMYPLSSNSRVYIKMKIVTISGTTIQANQNYCEYSVGNNVSSVNFSNNYIYITKVIGFKY